MLMAARWRDGCSDRRDFLDRPGQGDDSARPGLASKVQKAGVKACRGPVRVLPSEFAATRRLPLWLATRQRGCTCLVPSQHGATAYRQRPRGGQFYLGLVLYHRMELMR